MRRATEIADLVLFKGKPPLRALADVTLRWSEGQVTIRRFAVFEKPSEPPWASVPRLCLEKDDRKTYVPLIDLPTGLKRRVLKAVLDEYRRVSKGE